MIQVEINVQDAGVKHSLQQVMEAISGSESASLLRAGGEAARDDAAEYHRGFDEKGGWKGNRYLGGNPKAGKFGAQVAQGWTLGSVGKSGVSIINNAPHLAFKVSGGTITPKRAKALTIPLVREASGLHARDYVRITGNRLFTIKDKNALFERIRGITQGSRGRRGQAGATSIQTSAIRAVFALVRSVTQRPWPNALPPEDRLAESFRRSYLAELIRVIEKE